MDFRILGPVEVLDGGVPLPLGGSKQRAILAALIVASGDVVSVDKLVDSLWPASVPETASTVIHGHVSRLRKALGSGAERLVTHSPGYRLILAADELDARRFETQLADGLAAVEDADPRAAADLFRAALSEWRGEALAEFPDLEFVRPEAERLSARRLFALECRIEADLALGRHRDVLGEVETLVVQHPLDERLAGDLILALYRSGRQAEALAAYRGIQTKLREELGIDPGHDLQRLERAALRQDPELELATGPAVPSTARADAVEIPQEEEPVGNAGRRMVTVVACQVRIEAGGGALDPERQVRIMPTAVRGVQSVFESHGASVWGALGGDVTAMFGLPLVNEDDALRGVRAASALHPELEAVRAQLSASRGSPRLEVRAGVATGEVLAHDGDTYPVGEPIQVAGRLAQAARPGEVLIDEDTYRLVRNAVEVESAAIRGAEQASDLSVLRLVQVVAEASQLGAGRAPAMVGRTEEIELLERAFSRVLHEARCSLFTVLGDAGVGKSRLVSEFARSVRDEATILTGRCLHYGEGITFWPVAEIVRQAAGISDDDSPAEARRRIGELLGEGQGDLADQIDAIIGAGRSLPAPGETFGAIRRLLETLARIRPLIVVFDDLHWGAPTFLDLVEYIVEQAGDLPLLLVCLARTELLAGRPGWGGGKLNASTVLLAPLPERNAGSLVDSMLAPAQLDDAARALVMGAAEGNPLFIQEMLSSLVDEGAIVLRDGRWVLSGTLEGRQVPPTVHAVLAARLDRLTALERQVIQRASVIGREFYVEAVTEMADGLEPSRTLEALESLTRKDLVGRLSSLGPAASSVYRFRHILIRDAAYRGSSKQDRAGLHLGLADWLERVGAGSIPEFDHIIGYHLGNACILRRELGVGEEEDAALSTRAGRHLVDAARRSQARADLVAAEDLLRRALALFTPDAPERPEAERLLGAVLTGRGAFREAEELLSAAVDRAAAAGNERARWDLSTQRAHVRLYAGNQGRMGADLEGTGQRTIAALEGADDPAGLARAYSLLARIRHLQGREADAAALFDRALAQDQRAARRGLPPEGIAFPTTVFVLGPMPVEASIARCREVLIGSRGGHLAEGTAHLGHLLAMAGDLDGARAQFDRARGLILDLGAQLSATSIEMHAGAAEQLYGHHRESTSILLPSYERLREIGERGLLSTVAALLGHAACAMGRPEAAEEYSAVSETAAAGDDLSSQVSWRAVRAKALAARGAFAPAERLVRAGIEMADRTDFTNLRAAAHQDAAQVFWLARREEESATEAARATELYAAKGNRAGEAGVSEMLGVAAAARPPSDSSR